MKTCFSSSVGRYTGFVMVSLVVVWIVASGFRRITTAQTASGEGLYKAKCARCHGADGARGFLGAKNLRRSVLPDIAVRQQILMGKGLMPSFRKKLTEAETDLLVAYVKGLRAAADN